MVLKRIQGSYVLGVLAPFLLLFGGAGGIRPPVATLSNVTPLSAFTEVLVCHRFLSGPRGKATEREILEGV